METRRIVVRCPTCECRRRMLAQHAEWYGWVVTCTHCGDQWQDGERLRRGRRKLRAEQAKRVWLAGVLNGKR